MLKTKCLILSVFALVPNLLSANENPKSPQSKISDPIKFIEGNWKGFRDDYEVDINDGNITYIKKDDKKRAFEDLKLGTVIAKINKFTKVESQKEGDYPYYNFAGSGCLDAMGPYATFKYVECSRYGSELVEANNTYVLRIAGFEFIRYK